jgi:vancomycin resistance protein YoaR
MRAEVGVRPVRERRTARVGRGLSRAVRTGWRWALLAVCAVLVGLVAAGVIFAGSPDRIPAGVSVAGVKLSGLTPEEAEAKLTARAAELASVPVVFTAAGRSWPIEPRQLNVRVDWKAVVAEARAEGDAPLPLRGLKRVQLRLFGADLEPHAKLYDAGLDFRLAQIAAAVGEPARAAAIELDGQEPRLVPARGGRELDVAASRTAIVTALASFDRERVALPVVDEEPSVSTEALRPVLAQVRTALSAPVRFVHRSASWRMQPAQLARFLVLPADGRTELRVGGPRADRYFDRLAGAVDRPPQDADFAVGSGGSVRVVPAQPGRSLDVEGSETALLAAALSSESREARLVVREVQPKLTTAKARSFGITQVLASYSTLYAGTSDRIHNLQLGVSKLDGTRIAPGAIFSFNDVVGPRTEARGFRSAPVIIGNEYEEGIGGGVSQVATTVFNAAWEAGLELAERHPHALYIDRYELGRDATVNYPNLDLKFVNDTDGWLVLETGYGETGIAVTILGGSTGRRVESEAGALEVVAEPKEERVLDPALFAGAEIVEDDGEPSRSVTVVRTVYEGDTVLRRETWTTTYRSQPRIVRYGAQPKPAPPPPKTETVTEPTVTTPPATTTTEPTTTEPTSTVPADGG